MDEIDEFILREYESAQKLTYHVDEMRSKLTQFFIALSGVAFAATSSLLNKDIASLLFGVPWWVVASFITFLCAVLGSLFVLIIAKLRRTQIEHFHITNNIRQYFLDKSDNADELWRVVALSHETIPKPTRSSGSYYWVLLIIILTSLFFAIFAYLLSANLTESETGKYLCAGFFLFFTIFVLDRLYIDKATFVAKIQQSV
ncbi:hypothetical protein [Vibrio parahaemolyticus]|uniref:hypothetical protein n=1 Tax=Vibrio parahaemolyticus TaxID=670 RepID=UPI00235E7850|nr:hypothetical protein [Vibrio parahaemolyticus]ELI5409500.1 hypothetical protein [Vibrio parahaemolyticus]